MDEGVDGRGESGKEALSVQGNEDNITKCEMDCRLKSVMKHECDRCVAVDLIIFCVQG